jgi:hypothetical protein
VYDQEIDDGTLSTALQLGSSQHQTELPEFDKTEELQGAVDELSRFHL